MKLRIEDADERIKFVLASYNVGIGHVLDAMSLADKYGKDPKIWENNVDYYLLHKSEPKYYNDPVVKFGYCRGEEPYHYVTEILERYEHYMNATLTVLF
jgi:membrane-bound lytic murein transglycosylase F